jgi:tetratricopeptide (TPR) repeat protein
MTRPLAPVAIALLAAVLYSNTLGSPFVLDDGGSIVQNRFIEVTELGFGELYEAAFASRLDRPVAYASFALNYYFGRYEVAGYHVVNIAIHAINGILVYLLALFAFRRRSGARQSLAGPMALFAALVFVSHPLQTQSVTYIVQRMNSLATMFYLLALLLYLHGRLQSVHWRRWAFWTGGLVAWALALGSKEIAAVLPLAILLCEWTFFSEPGRAQIRRRLGFALGGALILGLLALVYIGDDTLDRISRIYRYRDFTMAERLLTQPRVILFYLSLWILPLPSRLNLDHFVSVSRSVLEPLTTLPSLLVLVGLVALAVLLARKYRFASFCILWLLLHLAIESSVIGLELCFEHRMYLPSVGLALLTSDLLLAGFGRRRFASIALATLVVGLLGTATLLRNQVWRDELTLWSDAAAKSPEHKRAQLNLGIALADRGREDEAVARFREALRIEPRWAPAHVRLALSLDRLGERDAAEAHLREALRLRPNDARTHSNLGLLLAKSGRIGASRDAFQQALRLDPSYAPAHLHLAIGLELAGRHAEAIERLSEALRLDPRLDAAANNLAWLLATGQDETLRDPERALEIARDLAAQAPEPSPGLLDTLAAAQAAAGDFDAAVHTLERALELADTAGDTGLRAALSERLRLYRAGVPYRESR